MDITASMIHRFHFVLLESDVHRGPCVSPFNILMALSLTELLIIPLHNLKRFHAQNSASEKPDILQNSGFAKRIVHLG
jgi:hypothetical protein